MFISWVIFSLIFAFSFTFLTSLGTSWVIILPISLLFLVCIKSFDYVIQPQIFYYFRKNRRIFDFDHIIKESDTKAKVIVVDKLKNAYATGLRLFYLNSVIMLGSDLMSKMNEQQIKGIVWHEIAHLKFRHLYVLLFLDAIGFYIIFIAVVVLEVYYPDNMLIKLFVISLLSGCVIFLQMGMRRYELKADVYAASKVGADVYISALEKLNKMANGKMEKFDFSHPKLSTRIKNIRKNVV